MLKAKSIIKDKFYIVEDSNGKVGTVKVSGDAVEYYNTQLDTSVTMTLKEFVADFVVENKNDTVQTDYVTVFGYPTNVFEAFNERSQNTLPVFTKKANSNIEYVAGYYAFEYPNNGWTRAYVPKLKTLDDYPWMGPFKTESDMLLAIRRKKKEL
jgi:hypothetical protein